MRQGINRKTILQGLKTSLYRSHAPEAVKVL